MPNKTIQTGLLLRSYELRKEDVNQEARTVALTFSSEEPYDRWFGTEILDHAKKSVLLDRLNTGGPLLVGHNPDDHVGVVEEAKVGSDRRGRAVVRLGKSQRAQEIFQDVVDGIRKNVSVGYRVHQMVLEKSDKTETGEQNTYRVTRWEPLEVSLVAVPADNTVGVGRAAELERAFETEIIEPESTATREATPAAPAQPNQEDITMPEINVENVTKAARDAEQKRIREITAYGEQFNCREAAQKAVADGTELDLFRMQVLEQLGKVKPVETKPELGLSKQEAKRFSFMNLIRHLANPGDMQLRHAAEFEIECSRAYADVIHKAPQGLWVPPDVLQLRTLSTTDAVGGYSIATNLLAASFIELLRNRMIVMKAGATSLMGLTGDVAIPKQSGGATAYWVADGSDLTTSTQAFDQVTLQPRTVGAFTDITRKLLIQSSLDIEALVRRDLAAVLGIAIDLAALHGSGSGNQQPTGVAGTSGIGSVACGTNGGAPTYADVINLETEVAIDNADFGTLAYVTNSKVRGKLKQTQKVTTYGNDFVWQDGQSGDGIVNGYRALVSNQVSATLTKGSATSVCSAIFFGNWADLIVGMWSGVDILVDPYTGSKSGTVRVVALQDVDIAVRHAESFAAILDATTT